MPGRVSVSCVILAVILVKRHFIIATSRSARETFFGLEKRLLFGHIERTDHRQRVQNGVVVRPFDLVPVCLEPALVEIAAHDRKHVIAVADYALAILVVDEFLPVDIGKPVTTGCHLVFGGAETADTVQRGVAPTAGF